MKNRMSSMGVQLLMVGKETIAFMSKTTLRQVLVVVLAMINCLQDDLLLAH